MLNLIGVVIAFIVILILIRKKVNFGLSLFVGSLIVGVFSLEVITPIDIPKAMIEASFYSFEKQQIMTETLELALLMTLIFVLAKSMQETGAITKLIDSLRTFFSKGGTLGVIPAVYGLMPVPGGALFSAPLIDKEGDKYKLQKDQKNFLNIWFRHVWFPIYPISAAMILICSIKFSGVPIQMLILADLPAFIGVVLIGFIFLKRFTGKTPHTTVTVLKDYRGLVYILPPIVPILFYPLKFIGLSETRCFLIGVSFSLLLLYALINIDVTTYVTIIKKSLTWNLALAIFGIMILREMMKISQMHLLITETMQSLAFPALLIVILIPLLLGTLTGYNLGAIALSYPLVDPFFAFTGVHIIGLTSLIFMSSLIGYLISPIHLCNVLSSEYLKTDTTRMYKMFIPAAITLLLIQTLFVIIVFPA
jgi:integral membrane protein (TIGR00529 family)